MPGCIWGITVPVIAASARATLSTTANLREQNSVQIVSAKSRPGRLSSVAVVTTGRAEAAGEVRSALVVRCAIICGQNYSQDFRVKCNSHLAVRQAALHEYWLNR